MLFKLFFIFALVFACLGQEINIDNDFNHSGEVKEDIDITNSRNPDVLNFYLYRHAHPNTPETVLATDESISAANFNSSLMTIVLIHGHGETVFLSSNQYIRNAIFSLDDVNLIVVDWSIYSRLTYTQAASAVPQVGAGVATFIDSLIATPNNARIGHNDKDYIYNVDGETGSGDNENDDESGEDEENDNDDEAIPADPVATLSKMHIIGFNLGAHIAGIAGRRLPGLARVTGLDPAASQWGAASPRLRLTDASYVEVIHTDGGSFGNGLGTPVGLVDIFANGGSNQPGCLTHSCSHNRAYELFAASIVNPNLVANHCATMLAMNLNLCKGTSLRIGQHDRLMKSGSGIYRINTRRNYPF